MKAALATEENKLNMHESNGETEAKEQSIWSCVAYKGYIDLLKRAKSSLVVKDQFDSIWLEKDEGKQMVKACKLIITIAREDVGTTYLCLIGPLLQPARPVKKLSKGERAFARRELLAVVDPCKAKPRLMNK